MRCNLPSLIVGLSRPHLNALLDESLGEGVARRDICTSRQSMGIYTTDGHKMDAHSLKLLFPYHECLLSDQKSGNQQDVFQGF